MYRVHSPSNHSHHFPPPSSPTHLTLQPAETQRVPARHALVLGHLGRRDQARASCRGWGFAPERCHSQPHVRNFQDFYTTLRSTVPSTPCTMILTHSYLDVYSELTTSSPASELVGTSESSLKATTVRATYLERKVITPDGGTATEVPTNN